MDWFYECGQCGADWLDFRTVGTRRRFVLYWDLGSIVITIISRRQVCLVHPSSSTYLNSGNDQINQGVPDVPCPRRHFPAPPGGSGGRWDVKCLQLFLGLPQCPENLRAPQPVSNWAQLSYRGSSFRPLVFTVSFSQWQPCAHDHRWRSNRRSTGESIALSSASATTPDDPPLHLCLVYSPKKSHNLTLRTIFLVMSRETFINYIGFRKVNKLLSWKYPCREVLTDEARIMFHSWSYDLILRFSREVTEADNHIGMSPYDIVLDLIQLLPVEHVVPPADLHLNHICQWRLTGDAVILRFGKTYVSNLRKIGFRELKHLKT